MGEEKTYNIYNSISAEDVKKSFRGCYDYEQLTVDIGGRGKLFGQICFIDGLVAGKDVAELVVRPITDPERLGYLFMEPVRIAEKIASGLVYSYNVNERTSLDDVVSDLLNGFCVLFIDGYEKALTFETRSFDKRSIDLPKEEKVAKGSKDAFVELIKTNTMLIRRRLKDKRLKIEQMNIGSVTDTIVTVIYLDGYTNINIVNEVKARLGRIDTKALLSASDIEENICDEPRSPFPQLITTERPDKFCINILEGRVGILADGLPIGYLAPGTFTQFFKVPEDKASHFTAATMLTVLRFCALALSLLLPAFYVAVAMYHQEMIPTKLMLSIIESKQAVPFPTAFEVIGMLISFELLQEAGLRLPNPVGQTVSIIGALIVGQSAVEAKVVSPVVIIVVAMAGIAGYTVPNLDMGNALRLCRIVLVLAAIFAGMFGLAIGCSLIIYHLCSIESFGVSYMTPFAGGEGKFLSRAVTRAPAGKTDDKESALFGEGE